MKNKLLGKWKVSTILFWVLSGIASLIIIVGLAVAGVFGFNPVVDNHSAKTVTVSYEYISKVSTLERVCENSFAVRSGVAPTKKTAPQGGDFTEELVYYFDVNISDERMEAIVSNLKTDIAAAQAEGGTLEDVDMISVYYNTDIVQNGVSGDYVLRAGIALAVFSVLAFAYVALRYRLSMGLSLHAALAVAITLTVGLVAITRIPVAPSFGYVLVFAVIAAVVMTLLTFNRFRDNAKDKDKQKGMSSQEKVACAIQRKPLIVVAATLAVAVVLMGVLIPTARWFAVACLAGLLSAVFSAWLVAPALLVVFDKVIKTGDKPLFRAKKKSKKQKVTAEVAADVADESVEETEEPQA